VPIIFIENERLHGGAVPETALEPRILRQIKIGVIGPWVTVARKRKALFFQKKS
jgi:hypothetical protein